MNVKRKILYIIFSLMVVAGSVVAILNLMPVFRSASRQPARPSQTPPSIAVMLNEEPPPVLLIPEEEIPPEVEPAESLPVGKLVVTKERQAYEEASLTLVIPELNLSCLVYDGTSSEVLSTMAAGLYEYAQLPGEGNRNTSMAGHRNTRRAGVITDKAPFYYVDRLKEGDFIYLHDEEYIYRYLWEFCEIVEADDWSMIRTTGYSCITITSCHPIGISDHRIVIRGRLDAIDDYRADYAFLSASPQIG